MTTEILPKIIDHEEQALARLLQQYKDKNVINSVIKIYAKQVQDLEDALFDFYNKRTSIEDAEGVLLDNIGTIVDQSRGSRNDAQYRTQLFIKIGTNTSSGDAPRVIDITKLLTQSEYVHYINLKKAELELEITQPIETQEEVNSIFRAIELVMMAGVRLVEIRYGAANGFFAFDGPKASFNEGFSDDAGIIGGRFAFPYRFALPFSFAGDEIDQGTAGFGAGDLDPLIGGAFIDTI